MCVWNVTRSRYFENPLFIDCLYYFNKILKLCLASWSHFSLRDLFVRSIYVIITGSVCSNVFYRGHLQAALLRFCWSDVASDIYYVRPDKPKYNIHLLLFPMISDLWKTEKNVEFWRWSRSDVHSLADARPIRVLRRPSLITEQIA